MKNSTEKVDYEQLFEIKFDAKTKKDQIFKQMFINIHLYIMEIIDAISKINSKINQTNTLVIENNHCIEQTVSITKKMESIIANIVNNQHEFVDVAKLLDQRLKEANLESIKIDRFYDYFKVLLDLIITNENQLN